MEGLSIKSYTTNETRFSATEVNGLDITLMPTRVIQTTLTELMAQYREYQRSKRNANILPCVTPDDLKQSNPKYVVIINEGDKEAPTEFVFDTLFELFSAAWSNNHALILKGSLKCDFLNEHLRKRASVAVWDTDYDSVVKNLTDFGEWLCSGRSHEFKI